MGSLHHEPQCYWSDGGSEDLEGEHDGSEPGADDEPSLGSIDDDDCQLTWADTGNADYEFDPAEASGIGDAEGLLEQTGFGKGVGSIGFAEGVE
jgi:hypothetical protein